MINKYIDYILDNGIAAHSNMCVEIVASSYIEDFINLIVSKLKERNIFDIVITYTDGRALERRLNFDPEEYIASMIEKYEYLISKGFSRISIKSPFTIPLANTNGVTYFNKNNHRFRFINEYFKKNNSTWCICAAANHYWANKLNISYDELWNRIFHMTFNNSKIDSLREKIEENNITKLHFITNEGTNLIVGLINKLKPHNKYKINNLGVKYQPNIPCLEVYTSPDMYLVDGILVGTKALYFNNKLIENYNLTFRRGMVINNENLEDILALDKGLFYAGEIALAETINYPTMYTTLLDENTGCHLALGMSVDGHKKANIAKYHIDLVFGSDSLMAYGITKDNNKIILLENGVIKDGL